MSPDAIEAALTQFDTRSRQATQAGAQAFARLLNLAEERESGQRDKERCQPDGEMIVGQTQSPQVMFRDPQDAAFRALTAGVGDLTPGADGSVMWTVKARDPMRLMRWVVENGPGLMIASPRDLADELRERLARVAALHG